MVGLIVRYNRLSGDRVLKLYEGPNGYIEASRDKAYIRDMKRIGGDWEVALIGSDSLDTIKRTHSRYFSGVDKTKEMAKALQI